MSEPRTKCTECGATILQSTADRYAGRCRGCHIQAAAIPPSSFQLAENLAQRLAALNEDPASFREMAWQQGPDFVNGFIDKLEERNRLRREWSPRLLAFAHKCRVEHPPPVSESLNVCERAMQGVYEVILNQNGPLIGLKLRISICSMPLIAIPVAQRLWPEHEDRIVLLTDEEETQWTKLYSHPEGSFEWYQHYWWSIDDSPEREFSLPDGQRCVLWDLKDVSEGENPWLVRIGYYGGPLTSYGHVELWTWNGRESKFIKKGMHWVS